MTAVDLESKGSYQSLGRETSRGRGKYPDKWRGVLKRTEHPVEIDLLRGHDPMPLEGRPDYADSVLVSRAERRPVVDFRPIGVGDRLPSIPIPSRAPDGDARVDLQEALDQVYDGAGYSRFIFDGVPDPPLKAEDSAWDRAFLPFAPHVTNWAKHLGRATPEWRGFSVSAWRRRALALFPDLRGEINPTHRHPYSYPYYMLFFDLLPLVRDAHASSDEQTLRRVYDFGEWCFRQDHRAWGLCNAACVAFYEHLLDNRRDWPNVAPWLSPAVIKACWPLWEARLGTAEMEALRKVIGTVR